MYRVPTPFRYQPTIIQMDPDCAICRRPAAAKCDCEAKGLDTAIRQAEARMMQSIYNDIRTWVRLHAQDYILEYFRLLTERRKAAHQAHLERITHHAYHYYRAAPPPAELNAAQAQLKRGIDEDWQASVQRYPEVLEYFFSLVDLGLPRDDDPAVKDPPLSALNGFPKRGSGRRGSKTPPAPEPRRVSSGRDRRSYGSRHAVPPAPPTSYFVPRPPY